MAKSRTISIQSVSCEDSSEDSSTDTAEDSSEDSATDTAEDSSEDSTTDTAEDSAEPDVSLSCDTTEGNDGCQKSPE